MFSYWIGLVALRRDIRTVGDGNPGASNLMRAGGKGWGILGLLLDYAKGIAPVLAARSVGGIEGSTLIPYSPGSRAGPCILAVAARTWGQSRRGDVWRLDGSQLVGGPRGAWGVAVALVRAERT
jgi:hypothetical protein